LLLNHTSESFQTKSCPESEGDLAAVPRQILQVQTTGHVEDDEDIDSGTYDLFGAGHGTGTLESATGDSNHQFRGKPCDEGEKDHATLDLALNESSNGGNPGKFLSRLWWWFH
jgi:hypothetical protein